MKEKVMFYNSFCRATGRVVIFTAIGLALAVAAVKVYVWSPALITAATQILSHNQAAGL
jgi:hypothetical protein